MDHIQKNMECPVYRIDGSVNKDDRVKQLSEFKSAPPGAVFIIQIKAGGQGLNLQEATRVYITGPSCFVSVEQEMMALQGHKSIVCSKVLNDERIENQIPVNRTSDKISIMDIKKIFKA